MSREIFEAIEQIEKTKGIPKETLKQAVEAALLSAYRKNFKSSHKGVSVVIDPVSGRIKVLAKKLVVENPKDRATEISLTEVRKQGLEADIGDWVEVEITPHNFGRIAAQTAKQVILQRIREAERELIYEEFYEKEGEVITGLISYQEGNNIIVDLGKTTGILPAPEQVASEVYRPGGRMKFYIVEVRKTTKGPKIILSRTHPGLVRRLLELEIPEIHDGLVDIKAIAREPGVRSKVAVEARDKKIDPIGACIGNRGSRIRNIIDELRGEKIDIILWSERPEEFIAEALNPAEVKRVELDEEQRVATVYVDQNQLSLAIGKEGQNARLAARITGWKIDIKGIPAGEKEEIGDGEETQDTP